jgi:membrane-associated phospholipid phosphatase
MDIASASSVVGRSRPGGPLPTPEGAGPFDPRQGGLAEHLARRSPRGRPVLAWLLVTLFGFVATAAVLVGLGLLLTHVLLPHGVGAWDNSANRWFVTQRTTTLNAITNVGSMLGTTLTVVGIAIVAGIVLAIGRHWRQIGFLAAGLLIEVGVFLTTAVAVDRPRPTVRRLDASPPTSSFPSGHTAAALVLYVGLAIVIGSLTRSRLARISTWLVAVLVPIFVALSRVYRGMHHPTDVAGSLVLASASLIFACLATRTASAVRLIDRPAPDPPALTSDPEVAA